MANQKLQNYLRTHRKRLGLTQKQVAFLIACDSDEQISRHENFSRVPSLETALAYEAIFHVPVRELFAGTFEEIDKTIAKRVRSLVRQLDTAESLRPADRHRYALVVALLENYPLINIKNNDEETRQH